MCKLFPVVLGVMVLVISSSVASAVLTVYEPYDYGIDTLPGQNGGVGFALPWGPYNNTNLGVTTDEINLVAPAGYGFTPQGGKLSHTIDNANRTVVRTLTNPIELNPAATTTTYFSILVSRTSALDADPDDNSNWLEFRQDAGSFGSVEGSFRTPNVNRNFTANFGGTDLSGKIQGVAGETYLLVGKLVAHPTGTNDELMMQVYQTGVDTVGAEPVVWDSSVMKDGTSPIGRIGHSWRPEAGLVEVDELRIGTEWIDVTGVPEPATIMLLVFGGLGVLNRKKRI